MTFFCRHIREPPFSVGKAAAVAHKMNRAYIGIDVSTESIHYALSRLERVIAGEQSGISKDIKWQGGGSFSVIEGNSANNCFFALFVVPTDDDSQSVSGVRPSLV